MNAAVLPSAAIVVRTIAGHVASAIDFTVEQLFHLPMSEISDLILDSRHCTVVIIASCVEIVAGKSINENLDRNVFNINDV